MVRAWQRHLLGVDDEVVTAADSSLAPCWLRDARVGALGGGSGRRASRMLAAGAGR